VYFLYIYLQNFLNTPRISVNYSKDRCIFVNYLPPINSTYYDRNDVKLFSVLEDGISRYSELGDIIVIGDCNSRTGTDDDFITHDRI